MLRIYLTGEPCLHSPAAFVPSGRLPRRQGRLAFTVLVTERARPVPRDELADVLWPESLPAAHEVAVSALVSKLRRLFIECGLESSTLAATDGCYCLHLPASSWVDTEAAHEAVHAAEAALRVGATVDAYGPAAVAAAILRRPFLPGESGEWVGRRRDALRQLLLRALEVLVDVHEWNREPALAVRIAEQAIAIEPYRETGYRRLMLLHRRAGDRAQALRVYERCRGLLAAELSTQPSPETEAVRAAL